MFKKNKIVEIPKDIQEITKNIKNESALNNKFQKQVEKLLSTIQSQNDMIMNKSALEFMLDYQKNINNLTIAYKNELELILKHKNI